MDMVKITRFDVFLVSLDPTIGSEIKKTRPAMIISPEPMNLSTLKTVIIAPMTSTIKNNFPTRILTEFKDRKAQIALDQLRSIDRNRIVKKLGVIDNKKTQNEILNLLSVIFQK